MSFLLVPEALVLCGVVTAIVWFAVTVRRRQRAAPLTAVGTVSSFGGAIIAALGALHIIAVADRALGGRGSGADGTFAYDFHFYALMHLGVLVVGGGMA